MEGKQTNDKQRDKITSEVLVLHCVKQERIVLVDLTYEQTQNAVTLRCRALFPPEISYRWSAAEISWMVKEFLPDRN